MLIEWALRKALAQQKQSENVNLLVAITELMRDYHVHADYGFERAIIQSVASIQPRSN